MKRGVLQFSVVRRIFLASVVISSILTPPLVGRLRAAEPKSVPPANAEKGRLLFERVWKIGENATKDDDGLGPMFNERSCVACHALGGVGGGGPNQKNVDLLTVVVPEALQFTEPIGVGNTVVPNKPGLLALQSRVALIHDRLSSGGIVLHTYGVEPEYARFREQVLGLTPSGISPVKSPAGELPIAREPPGNDPIKTIRIDDVTLLLSRRNSSAMFGAGLIDKIAEMDIQAIADDQPLRNPKITGRYMGRFGWRGQTSHLDSFVRNACVVELGLSVKDAPAETNSPVDSTRRLQGKVKATKKPKPSSVAKQPDLSETQVNDLIAFVASLPAPQRRIPADDDNAAAVRDGESLFYSVGCAECHRPSIGPVVGLYSDLLLHDMGPRLEDPQAAFRRPRATVYYSGHRMGLRTGELAREWKTPPLWGLADSAPYLHDGRAATVDEAILWHDGEASDSVSAYKALMQPDRDKLLAFLATLIAPAAQEALVSTTKTDIDKNEQKAASRLRLALALRDRNELDVARQWLTALVNDFPATKAAAEAQQLLPTLP